MTRYRDKEIGEVWEVVALSGNFVIMESGDETEAFHIDDFDARFEPVEVDQ